MQPWVEQELHTAHLGDERLDVRFRLVLDRLSLKPSLKFNAACRGQADVAGAYRFVNNPRAAPQTLLQPHADATLDRIREHPVALLVQDTSETDLTRPRERLAGAGPLNDADRLGFYFHPLLALTPERLPLGIVGAKIWARDADAFAQPAAAKAKGRKAKPIEDKESVRWLEGYRRACEVAQQCPQTQIVCISDSEGDIYECLVEGQQVEDAGLGPAAWIVRACQDRALVQDASAAAVGPLFTAAAAGPVLHRLTIEVSQRTPKSKDDRKRKQPRSARTAVVTVQALSVTLRGVWRTGAGKQADVTVQAVLVREEQPPAGEEPIEWLLLTSLPIDTTAQVLLVVQYYCCRWQIEIYFRVLKSGCQVEASQLESAAAFEAYLVLCMIVAWRVLYVLMLGRECPELPCDSVLEEDEWQAVYAVVKKQTPPSVPPPLGDMVKMIASLGGYLGRKGDGPPGPKAMWQGMQRMTDLGLGWHAFASIRPRPTG
jgi:hypothetical protein